MTGYFIYIITLLNCYYAFKTFKNNFPGCLQSWPYVFPCGCKVSRIGQWCACIANVTPKCSWRRRSFPGLLSDRRFRVRILLFYHNKKVLIYISENFFNCFVRNDLLVDFVWWITNVTHSINSFCRYPQRDYLMTPFLNPSTPAEAAYNAAHISTRCTIERAIGVLKQRFR